MKDEIKTRRGFFCRGFVTLSIDFLARFSISKTVDLTGQLTADSYSAKNLDPKSSTEYFLATKTIFCIFLNLNELNLTFQLIFWEKIKKNRKKVPFNK